MGLRRLLKKVSERWQNMPFLGNTRDWYQYQTEVVPVPMVRGKVALISIKVVLIPIKVILIPIKVVPVPIHRKGLVPVPIKVVPVPMLLAALLFVLLYC